MHEYPYDYKKGILWSDELEEDYEKEFKKPKQKGKKRMNETKNVQKEIDIESKNLFEILDEM